MALSRFVLPFPDVGGGIKPSSGAKLFFYATGTSTPASTFSDLAGSTANTNPVIADANGLFSDIFLSGTFKVILKDANDVQIWEADPVTNIDEVPSTSVTFLQGGTGAVARTVESKLRESVSVKDYNAKGDIAVTDDTAAIQAAVDSAVVSSVGYTDVFIPPGLYSISSPILCPANYRFVGNNAVIKAAVGFTGVTRNNIGDGGTIVLESMLLFLLGNYNDIERMPYSTIECKVINTIAGGNAIDVGPYCWGTHLNGNIIEDFAENAIAIGFGSNGVTITSPRIWGKTKTGASGVLVKSLANINGLVVNGGFIEKIAYGVSVQRGNGPILLNGVDLEVCSNSCVLVNGNVADAYKSTVGIKNCYMSSIGSNVDANYAKVTVEGSRLRLGDNFKTGSGGFIDASNNDYESGLPAIVAGSNVALDVEQSWTPTLLDDSLSPSEGQTYSVASGTYSRSANKVFFKGIMTLASIGTLATGESARIGGLPFSSSSTANTQSTINIGYGAGLSLSAVNAVSGYIGVGSDYATLQKFSAATGTSNLTVGEVSASGVLIFSGWYTL